MGALALAVVTAFAIAAAWPPLYRAGRVSDSPSIASCEAIAVIGLPVVAAFLMADRIQHREPIPLIAPLSFAGSIAVILFVSDYRAATVAAVAMGTVPTLTAAIAIGWLLMPGRSPEPAAELMAPGEPLPDPTTLYRFYRADGQLLYVGITRNFDRRQRAHVRAKAWWPEVARTETAVYADRMAAARAEHAAITGENPVHNAARYSLEAHLRAAAGQ